MRIRILGPAALLAILAGLAGCGGSAGGPGHADSANRAAAVRNDAAAQATAQTEFGLLAGGDYGGAWDLWTPAAQQAITRTDFIRLNTACRVSPGLAVQLVSITPQDGTHVAVSWRRGTESGSALLVYSAGGWRYEPDPATLADYRQGVDALLVRRRAAHLCASPATTG